jgi:hypothetical protein
LIQACFVYLIHFWGLILFLVVCCRAYTTGLNLLGHALAKSEEALVFLFTEVSQQHKSGRLPAIHVAGRLYPRLVQWFLAAKLKLLR